MLPDDFTEKIELLVNDESRIVTYKVLSQELKIHVNKAKLFLMEFMNAQKSKGVNLEVHYFLAGFSETSGLRSVKVLVVSEENLEKAKEGFTELTSCHIYSIFKGTSKDECALYSADFCYTKNQANYNKYSAIKHPNIEIQPPVLNKIQVNKDENKTFSKKELHGAANGSLTAAVSKKVSQVQPTHNISPEQGDSSKDNQNKESKENKASPGAILESKEPLKSSDKKQKSGTLMSMWEKKDQSNGVKKEKKEITKAGTKGKETVSKNNILSMFSKQAVKNLEKPTPKVVSNVETSQNPVTEVIKTDNSTQKVVQASENKKSSQKRKVSKRQSKTSKSKQDSDSDREVRPKAKKHRRICTFDDSSSESEPEEEKEKAQRSFFLSEEPMDVVPATPVSDESEDVIPPTPPVVHIKGKAKIWKTVQKTYEDEDGFFVTKNEKELVSASEDEEDPLKDSKTKKSEMVEKKIPAVNKKQATLMSFFKQK